MQCLSIVIVASFVLVLVIGLICFAAVGRMAFSKTEQGAGKSFGLLFARGDFLRISTAVFALFALVALAISGKLTEGAVAVSSGITGFVLGGCFQRKFKGQ